MGLVSYIQAALTLTLGVVAVLVFAAVRALRGDVRALLTAFRKTHDDGYPGPTGAAVVTEGAPPDHGDSARAAAPVPMEPLDLPALAPMPRAQVTVDDPADPEALEARPSHARLAGLSLDERVDARHDALCTASTAAGQPADHCMGPDCAEGCDCACDACARSLELYGQAEREITGRDAGPVHARIRVDVAPGTSPSERSVSFLVPEQTYTLRVDAKELDGELLRVELIGQVGGDVWIDLPAEPIAGGRRLPLPSSRVIVR